MTNILIAGTISDVGKTHVLALLLKKLKIKMAAVKVVSCKDPINHKCPKSSGCGVCLSVANTPYIIHRNRKIINMPNTDTGRMVASGADPVLWLVCRQTHLNIGLTKVINILNKKEFVLFEGNSVGKTDIPNFILMVLSPNGRIKKSARDIWHKVDFFIINKTDKNNKTQILKNQQKPINIKKIIDLNIQDDVDKLFSFLVN